METDGTHPALGACLVGAHRRCKPDECVIQSLFYGEHGFTRDIGQALLDEQTNGVVVFDGSLTEADSRFLRDHGIHVAILSFKARKDDWAITITYDRLSALSQAVEHLRALGHQRIGLVSYAHSSDEGNLHRHFAGLAFDHRLGDPNELLTLVNDTAGVTHWEDVERFFRIDPFPTAVVVTDEFLADVVLDGCERRSIRVPDQLSLVALQDARPLGHRIPLTTVMTADDLSRRTAAACDLLIRRIGGQPIPEPHVTLSAKLAVKASSGPAPHVFAEAESH
jgi:LacI family transcriptional regulator